MNANREYSGGKRKSSKGRTRLWSEAAGEAHRSLEILSGLIPLRSTKPSRNTQGPEKGEDECF